MSALPGPTTEFGITAPGGDPFELRDLAGFLRTAAEGFSQIAVNVRQAGAAALSSWSGVAAWFFEQRVGQTAVAIETAPDACAQAAEALEELARIIEVTQIRALEAQAAAGRALETLAEDALAAERGRGDRAFGDAQEAARIAAMKLHAAAEVIAPPLPPADPEVAPLERSGEWVRRQVGDLFYDPIAFWDPQLDGEDEGYKRGRTVIDFKSAYAGALIWGVNENRHKLFRLEDPRPGLEVPKTALSKDPVTGLPLFTRTTETRPSPITVPNVQAASKVSDINTTATKLGGALAAGTAGLDQWMQDRNRPDLDGGDRVERIVLSTVTVGGGSIIGVLAGIAAGAAVGGWVGGAVGGFVGAGAGATLGTKLKDRLFHAYPNAFS